MKDNYMRKIFILNTSKFVQHCLNSEFQIVPKVHSNLKALSQPRKVEPRPRALMTPNTALDREINPVTLSIPQRMVCVNSQSAELVVKGFFGPQKIE